MRKRTNYVVYSPRSNVGTLVVADMVFAFLQSHKISVNLQQLQDIIRSTYDAKDRRRGVEGTFMWFMEEVGELSAALRSGSDAERAAEFADVLAWLATLANIAGVDLDAAVQAKYGGGCPGCRRSPCACDRTEKP